MMDSSAGFSSAEFLDDYFAECDEHLATLRRAALALEPAVSHGPLPPGALDELLRPLHTIKGLSGMVGFSEVEQLAHRMESLLKAVRRGGQSLTGERFDTLLDSIKTLEAVLAARRAGDAPLDISSLLARLDKEASTEPVSSITAPADFESITSEPSPHLTATLFDGRPVWKVTFTPTADLAQRSVNVNTIRERLQQLGELVQAIPQVTPDGQIRFQFLLAGPADESSFAGWQDDGLTWERYTPSPAPVLSAAEPAMPPLISKPSTVVRVDLTRLDELMHMVGDLVISRVRLEEQLKGLQDTLPSAKWQAVQEVLQQLERQLRTFREQVMRVRMVPVGEVFERMEFAVRDLARETGKQIALDVQGSDTEIDKYVVDRLVDPLLHLVRNAVSHGLEAPDERLAHGKPATGRLTLRAATVGDMVLVEISDDGRGINIERVAARARDLGWLQTGETLPEAALLDVLCAPGFSTRDEADRSSGRGLGMNIVRSTVQQLGGSLSLRTQPGQGTQFTILLPLTLVIVDALIIVIGGQSFAIPLPAVREVIEMPPDGTTPLGKWELLPYRGEVLPLLRLRQFFHLSDQSERPDRYALIVGVGTQTIALAVDRVSEQREIVVRPLTDPLLHITGLAGAAEYGDGRALLILDAPALVGAMLGLGRDRISALLENTVSSSPLTTASSRVGE